MALRRSWMLPALLALTALRFLIVSPLIDSTALWASGRFVYPAQQLLRGEALYRDVWGHVPPLIYGLDALGWAVGGLWGIWLVALLFLLGAVVVGYRLLETAFGGTAAFFGMACGLLGLSLLLQGNQIEEYALLLQFGVFYAFARAETGSRPSAWSFLTGALIGLLFWLRPDLVGVGLAIALYLIVQMARRTQDADARLMSILIGALGIIFIGVGLLVIGGALAETWSAVARYNLAVSLPLGDRFGALLNGVQVLSRAGLPLIVLAAWGVGVSAVLIRPARPKDADPLSLPASERGEKARHKNRLDNDALAPQGRSSHLVGAALIALPVELILTLLDGSQAINHLILWLPAIAILSASLASILLASNSLAADSPAASNITLQNAISPRTASEPAEGPGVREILPARVWLAALLIAFSLMPLVDAANAFQIARTQNQGANAMRLQALDGLRQLTRPDDQLLVWGNEPMVNVLSGRRSPARVFEQLPLFVTVDPAQAPFASLADDVTTRLPAFVLDTATGGDRVPPINAERRHIWQLNQQAGFLPTVTITPELQLVLDTFALYYRPVARYGVWTLYARNEVGAGTSQ